MNNKDLKNKLKSEIESITPRVYDSVVQSSYIEKPVAKTKKAGASKAFRIATSAVACVLITAIAITCGVLFAPKKDNSPISNYYYVQVSAGADKATAAADEKTDCAKNHAHVKQRGNRGNGARRKRGRRHDTASFRRIERA